MCFKVSYIKCSLQRSKHNQARCLGITTLMSVSRNALLNQIPETKGDLLIVLTKLRNECKRE